MKECSTNNATDETTTPFPVDRPVEALLRDYNMVRKLADSYFSNSTQDAKLQVAQQILMLLEIHSLFDKRMFYPAAREIYASMIGHFKEEYQKPDEMRADLKRMTLSDPQALPMFEQALDMTMHHIEEEENELFSRPEQANMGMTPTGLQMQAYGANLVHIQARSTEQAARR